MTSKYLMHLYDDYYPANRVHHNPLFHFDTTTAKLRSLLDWDEEWDVIKAMTPQEQYSNITTEVMNHFYAYQEALQFIIEAIAEDALDVLRRIEQAGAAHVRRSRKLASDDTYAWEPQSCGI